MQARTAVSVKSSSGENFPLVKVRRGDLGSQSVKERAKKVNLSYPGFLIN